MIVVLLRVCRLSSVIFMNNNTKVEKDSFAETPYVKARTAFAIGL